MRSKSVMKLVMFAAVVMAAVMGVLSPVVLPRRARAFTVLTVMNTNDSGPGSLRDAVQNAGSGDTVTFNLPLPATITLTSGPISIGFSMTISGPGANQLTITGNNSQRVFQVLPVKNVSISGLTIASGNVDRGAGIISEAVPLSVTNCAFKGNVASVEGGAIFNSLGELSVTGCTFSGNSSSGAGGAIGNFGSLAVTGCTFAGNSAPTAGAIYSNEICSVINSTFSGYSATNGPGGAVGVSGSTGTIVNCTISGNSAKIGGGAGLVAEPSDTLILENTIIAGNMGGDCTVNLSPGLAFTNSHNLIGDGSCSPMLSGNPQLGPLQNNGGPTQTSALLSGSPAIDAGDDTVLSAPFSLTTDQRGSGFVRSFGAHVDIGAFELQPPPAPTFDTCLKDNTSGNLLQWNSTTGQYQLTRCSGGSSLSGTGTVRLVNGIRTLTDNKSDRKISANFNLGQLTGGATIYLQIVQGVWQTIRIIDTNPSAICKC